MYFKWHHQYQPNLLFLSCHQTFLKWYCMPRTSSGCTCRHTFRSYQKKKAIYETSKDLEKQWRKVYGSPLAETVTCCIAASTETCLDHACADCRCMAVYSQFIATLGIVVRRMDGHMEHHFLHCLPVHATRRRPPATQCARTYGTLSAWPAHQARRRESTIWNRERT